MPNERGGKPVNLADALGVDQMFAHDDQGRALTRQRVCECGRRFTQNLLSPRFLEMVERQSKRAIELLSKQIPDYFVPVHCPSCERVDLGHSARLTDYTQPFGERDAAD